MLHNLRLRGQLPDAGWSLPTSLTVLDLFNNSLSGAVPSTFYLYAPSLQTFSLASEHPVAVWELGWQHDRFVLCHCLCGQAHSQRLHHNMCCTLANNMLFRIHPTRAGNCLTGSLPTWVELPDSVTNLCFNNNAFSGTAAH